MGMHSVVAGFRPADDEWIRMKELWDLCDKQKIDPPQEVKDFFYDRVCRQRDELERKLAALLKAAEAVDEDAWESNREHDDKYRVVRCKWLLDLKVAIKAAKEEC